MNYAKCIAVLMALGFSGSLALATTSEVPSQPSGQLNDRVAWTDDEEEGKDDDKDGDKGRLMPGAPVQGLAWTDEEEDEDEQPPEEYRYLSGGGPLAWTEDDEEDEDRDDEEDEWPSIAVG